MERRRAGNWYVWLWVSPMFTVPSLYGLTALARGALAGLICRGTRQCVEYALVEQVSLLTGILASALWHLILLYPAFKDDSEFVRWHGRQALLLAGIRTAVPLVCVVLFGLAGESLFMLVLLPIYFVGNLRAQRQATRGDCFLMRRFGRAEALPLAEPVVVAETPKAVARKRAVVVEESMPQREPAVVRREATEDGVEALVDIIRYGRDPEERGRALSELEKLGMVESL